MKIRTKKQNSQYWSDRMTAIEAHNHKTAIATYAKAERALRMAEKQLDSDIAYWLSRIAGNNDVSLTEARRLLNAQELEEFKWTIDEYIKYGRENALDEAWVKELENASAKAHISRLEALKLSMRQTIEQTYKTQYTAVSDGLSAVFAETYHHTAFEVQRGYGIGFSFGKVDERKVRRVINRPWAEDGSDFSDRLWVQKTKMVNRLQGELTRTILTGDSPDAAISNMTAFVDEQFKNAKSVAGRLVMTESAAIASDAQKECYADLGVEKFQVIATLDRITCDVCGARDEQPLPRTQFEVGVTAPPFHPNCRCTTAPYYDDEFEHDGERAYRDENGKTQYVADMSYTEWAKIYLKDRGAT